MGNRFTDNDLSFIKIKPRKELEGKSLTADRQTLRERFAHRIARQEEAFKNVFNSVFDEQRNAVVDMFERVHALPDTLNDEQTAQKFQAAIELVYESGFEDAV